MLSIYIAPYDLLNQKRKKKWFHFLRLGLGPGFKTSPSDKYCAYHLPLPPLFWKIEIHQQKKNLRPDAPTLLHTPGTSPTSVSLPCVPHTSLQCMASVSRPLPQFPSSVLPVTTGPGLDSQYLRYCKGLKISLSYAEKVQNMWALGFQI